jgi:microcompartment protein CcmK/EutM
LQSTGKQLICLDCTGAGAGEIVYYVRGKEASFPFLPAEPPTDATVVGIVDSIHLKREPQVPTRVATPVHRKGKRC